MTAVFAIENHEDLLNVGVRTHDQIDAALDALEAAVGTGSATAWHNFAFFLEAAHLVNEVSPAVVRVELPAGKSLDQAKVIFGTIDGRKMPSGYGWQPSADGAAVEIYVPVDPDVRARYLNADLLYELVWLV